MVWRDVVGESRRYEVNEFGEVWRKHVIIASGPSNRLMELKPMKVTADKKGRVNLNNGNITYSISIEKIMERTFPDGHEYVAPVKKKSGRPANEVYAKEPTSDGFEVYENVDELARDLGVTAQTVRNAIFNKSTVKGYLVSMEPFGNYGTRETVIEDGLITFVRR